MQRFSIFVILFLFSSFSYADSYWNHNGSLMRLQAEGNQRFFYYQAPRKGMVEQGVKPNTLLFNGYVENDHYYGVARVFSKHCPEAPLEYSVEGSVINDAKGLRIVLKGFRPVYKKCIETGQRKEDRLEFIYQYKD